MPGAVCWVEPWYIGPARQAGLSLPLLVPVSPTLSGLSQGDPAPCPAELPGKSHSGRDLQPALGAEGREMATQGLSPRVRVNMFPLKAGALANSWREGGESGLLGSLPGPVGGFDA